MSNLKTIDFNIHYVNTLLLNKGKGSLTIVQNMINELAAKRKTWEKALPELKEKQDKLKESQAHAQEAFEKLIHEKEIKMTQLVKEFESKINSAEDNQKKIQKQLSICRVEEQKTAMESQISILGEQIKKNKENIIIIHEKHKAGNEGLQIKQLAFTQQIKDELAKIEEDIAVNKDLMTKSTSAIGKLDNLHHAITKNPSTLFNDSIAHDLVLFSHKDNAFKNLLNEFLEKTLSNKDFQTTIDKIGLLMAEVYSKSKGVIVSELIVVYSNLLTKVNSDGPAVLDEPMVKVLLVSEVEKSLRHYKDDLSLPEIIQIAKLSPEIHQKVLSLPICTDFFIQLMRTELKISKAKNEKFVPPVIEWDALIYLTTKWNFFFKKFGQSLNTFSEPDYIKMFKRTIEYTSQIIKNPVSEKIFTKILSLRELSKDTFQSNFKTKDYILLLFETVLMARSNELRNPHHFEVMSIYQELKEPFKTNFLKLFDPVVVKKMLAQEEDTPREQQENIYLRINKNYENELSLLEALETKNYEDIPSTVFRFLQTIRVDVSDHLAQLEAIFENVNHFEKNIGLSVVSSSRQLPLANAIYQSVIKCSEYISNPKSFESLCVSKELEKMLSRKVNLQKEPPKP